MGRVEKQEGVWGTLGKVGVQPQGQAYANRPRARMPSPGTSRDRRAGRAGLWEVTCGSPLEPGSPWGTDFSS